MASRFAVATNNWFNTATWSATSGGASGASVPTSADDVFFDSAFTVTISGGDARCLSLTMDAGVVQLATTRTLFVETNITLNAGSIIRPSASGASAFIGAGDSIIVSDTGQIVGSASGGQISILLSYPDEESVESGVTYGPPINNSFVLRYTGTLDVDVASNPPSENDVRSGVTYGSSDQFEGNMTEPDEGDVRTGVQYGANGTEFTGSFSGGGSTQLIGG